MKETPIIMSGSHPKLILQGIKTMTRRTAGLTYVNEDPDKWQFLREDNGIYAFTLDGNRAQTGWTCPYGQVGDRLWVRETWATERRLDHLSPSQIGEAGDVPIWWKASSLWEMASVSLIRGKWRPSIFMPRWASRITLEITEVRAERLRSISVADAIAEGAYTVKEFIIMYLKLNRLPEDADPWNWAISFAAIGITLMEA